jgi:uncharacterized protein YbjQ (UPF0145 family)
MIMTTTPTIEGKKVTAYLGIVVGDLFAGITDIIGGRSGAYEGEMATARETALRELEAHAADVGADAVIGVDLDYEVINNMMMVCASGTAVKVA